MSAIENKEMDKNDNKDMESSAYEVIKNRLIKQGKN